MGFFESDEFVRVQETVYKGCKACKPKECLHVREYISKDSEFFVLLPPPSGDDSCRTALSNAFMDVLGTPLEEQAYMPAVRCLPFQVGKQSKDDSYISDMIVNCRHYVYEAIRKSKCKLVYAVGTDAMRVLFDDVWKDGISGDLTNWRGFVIPHLELGVWVCPIYTPDFVQRKIDEFQPQALTIWNQDIVRGHTYINKKIPYVGKEADKKIKLLTEVKDIRHVLDMFIIEPPEVLAFDYETTGLKPRREGHKIICMSMCDGNTSYAFPMYKEVEDLVRRVLSLKGVKYIAHNMKFEWMWSDVKLGVRNIPFYYDPMLGQHYLDQRSGITGLKFQTFVYFGVGDYSSHTLPYIKGIPEKTQFNDGPKWENYRHGNCFNRMDEFNIRQNLEYCAKDSWFTYHLFEKHMELFAEADLPVSANKAMYGYDLLHKGALALCEVERNGFKVDVKYLEETLPVLTIKLAQLRKQILTTPFVKEWRAYYKDSFKLDSGDQLGKYLFEVKGIQCIEYTDKGKYATDAESLMKYGLPELEDIIEYKKLDKTVNTFLKGIWFERNDDHLHCFFNLNNTVSYRLSSDSPNLQNVPKRDKGQRGDIRKAFIPEKGHFLVEVDYSALEVYGSLAYTHDPAAKNYLINPEADMHKDNAIALFCNLEHDLDQNRVHEKYAHLISKELRQAQKGSYTFASQYGSYWKNTAKGTWDAIDGIKMADGTLVKDYLNSRGIHEFTAWQEHIKECDRLIWDIRFAVQAAWKKKNYSDYQKNGYFDSYDGFRYSGLMKRNNVNNYGIQGFCSHVVLYDIIMINKFIAKNKLTSRIISTIHDSIIFSINPKEVSLIIPYIEEICNRGVFKHFPYFDVPSHIEFDVGEIDGSWDTLKGMEMREILEKYKSVI